MPAIQGGERAFQTERPLKSARRRKVSPPSWLAAEPRDVRTAPFVLSTSVETASRCPTSQTWDAFCCVLCHRRLSPRMVGVAHSFQEPAASHAANQKWQPKPVVVHASSDKSPSKHPYRSMPTKTMIQSSCACKRWVRLSVRVDDLQERRVETSAQQYAPAIPVMMAMSVFLISWRRRTLKPRMIDLR